MKTRSLAACTGVVLFLAILPGCINYEQHTILNSDGSGAMTIHYWTAESVANFMSGEKLNFNDSGIRQQYEAKGVTVKEAVSESDPKDSTRHMRVTLEFENITALSNTKGFKGTTFTFKRSGDEVVFEQVMEANSSAGGLGLEKYTITYIYEMPGKVVSSNATNVKGSTLTWAYKLPELSKNVMLTATVTLGGGLSGGMLAAIIGGGVVLLSVVVFFVLRKRSHAPPAAA